MQDLHFVSEDYTKRKPKDYRLSISIRRDGFSFLIVHKDDVKAFSYITVDDETREEQLQKFLNQDIFKETFGAVTIIIVQPNLTLVPKKLYDDSMLEQYAELNFPHSETESVITYETMNSDCVVLFPIEKSVWSLCRLVFKNQEMVSYVPHVAPLLEIGAKNRKEKLYISVESNFFTALYVKHKDIRFCNSFEFKNVNDFMFYLMNIVEQLKLDPVEIPVEIFGKMSENSSYFSAIRLFIKNASVASSPKTNVAFPYSLFYNHCNIALCE